MLDRVHENAGKRRHNIRGMDREDNWNFLERVTEYQGQGGRFLSTSSNFKLLNYY